MNQQVIVTKYIVSIPSEAQCPPKRSKLRDLPGRIAPRQPVTPKSQKHSAKPEDKQNYWEIQIDQIIFQWSFVLSLLVSHQRYGKDWSQSGSTTIAQSDGALSVLDLA